MRIVIVCVGKVRPPFVDDVAHYERLLGRHARVETIELPEGSAEGARGGRSPGKARRSCGGSRPDGTSCVLDREGRPATSESLAGFVEERREGGGTCAS